MNSTIPLKPTEKPFKQIAYNDITGQLFLLDSNNNSYECNIYGHPISTFNSLISGTANSKKRIKAGHMQSLKFSVDYSVYHPQSKFFEGYFSFPKPLSQPFQNVLEIKNNKDALYTAMLTQNRLTSDKNVHLLQMKTNEGIHYMSSTISLEHQANKQLIINLINDVLKDYNERDIINQKQDYTHSQIIGLKKFKKILKLNLNNQIYGRILNQPTEKAKRHYQIVNQILSNLPNDKIKSKKEMDARSVSCSKILFLEDPFEKIRKNDKENDVLFTKENNPPLDAIEIKKEITYRTKMKIEKRLLNGYKKPTIIKEKEILQKALLPKLTSRGQHYKRELEIIEIVNPIVVMKEKKKIESDKILFANKRLIRLSNSQKKLAQCKKINDYFELL